MTYCRYQHLIENICCLHKELHSHQRWQSQLSLMLCWKLRKPAVVVEFLVCKLMQALSPHNIQEWVCNKLGEESQRSSSTLEASPVVENNLDICVLVSFLHFTDDPKKKKKKWLTQSPNKRLPYFCPVETFHTLCALPSFNKARNCTQQGHSCILVQKNDITDARTR